VNRLSSSERAAMWLVGMSVVVSISARADNAALGSATLRIEGTNLTIPNAAITAGVDVPTQVQTRFAGRENDAAPPTQGLSVVAELSGPGLNEPIRLTTAPGHRFEIPGLPRIGVYLLQNIRLMANGVPTQYASPPTATITVADLLKTSVSVKQLSPEELRARGIVVDARNFDVFEFNFSFFLDGGEPIVVPFPVIVDPRTHQIQPVRGEQPYSLPPPSLVEPPRWTPPTIIPLDFAEDDQLPSSGGELNPTARTGARPRLPAAIIIPNDLAVLHQFFAVSLMVSNGAPEGSTARLEDVRASARVPNEVRVVKTLPEVGFGQAVPVLDANTGAGFLVAQARGDAEWTMEGLAPGTYRVDFDLRATFREHDQIVPLRATPSAAIVVHDPRFNITFSHPATTRKGTQYSTYAFVTNLSAVQQTVSVSSGIPSCESSPEANVCGVGLPAGTRVPDVLTIPPGQTEMIEYRLRAGATGQVFATAGTVGERDAISAAMALSI
jgi:hypothetical protein